MDPSFGSIFVGPNFGPKFGSFFAPGPQIWTLFGAVDVDTDADTDASADADADTDADAWGSNNLA